MTRIAKSVIVNAYRYP